MEDTAQLADWIRTACRLEVLAPKPGNVHPGASFEDLAAEDFLQSAEIIAPILARAQSDGFAESILAAVEATQHTLGRNTNLGIILLLAPLAAVPLDQSLTTGIASILNATTIADSVLVYRAIRCAMPGGMGQSDEQDLSDEPTLQLRDIMQLAADRDGIAAQYANGFHDVLQVGVPELLRWTGRCADASTAIVGLHLSLMSALPDTLIARKCGVEIAQESARRAAGVLETGWPDSAAGTTVCREFDRWLRADGHRRNPGTSADLVAAILFAAQRDFEWTAAK